jgi:predicted NUDIX family NTP pyrophosphohydrolase
LSKISAGLLMYHYLREVLQVLLVHPGGPFWMKKDLGAWSIPKGEYSPDEDPLKAAKREFLEETGFPADGKFIALHDIRQKSGKRVKAWIFSGNLNPEKISSNTFEIEWPPRSGKMQSFPEIDRAAWFSIAQARKKILKSQLPFLDELEKIL